jgi:succinate dehydrogenase/fumarate reductase cytochrome b subunit
MISSSYDLFLQSLSGFLIIVLIFVPFLKWAFTSKSQREEKARARQLKQDLKKLRRK